MENKYMTKVFVIEDDLLYAKIIQRALEQVGNYDVSLFHSGETFLQSLHLNPDIVTIDHNLPDMAGLEILKKVRNYNVGISCVIVSGQAEVEVVVQAYKHGAKDYIIKRENLEELVQSIVNLSANVNLQKQVEELRERIINREKYTKIIGESPAVLKVLRLIQKVESSDMTVLITGSSGTGKELIANAIHYHSPRVRKPLVVVNMAAIPEDLIESELFGHEKGSFTGASGRRIGKFEEADGGTIFLDEMGEMNVNLQTKLLRVLQEKRITRIGANKEIPVDLRIVAATNRNLMDRVQQGYFREDLYYRLSGFLIHLPGLKERGNDIIILAKFFLKEFFDRNKMAAKTFSHDAIETMLAYDWPGNIRELKSTVERAALISDTDKISSEDLMLNTGDLRRTA